MIDDKIKDKIKKLLALSTSSNEHEAALSLKMANDLLSKHNLEMKDLSGDSDMIIQYLTNKKAKNWHIMILDPLCQYNYCIALASLDRSCIAGRKFNVEITKDQCIKIIKWISKLARIKYPNMIKLQNDYKTGCAISIVHRIEKLIKERDLQENSTALIVLNDEADKYAQELTAGRTKKIDQKARVSMATIKGMDDGKSIPIFAEVG